MWKFLVFDDGKPAESWVIRNPYLLDQNGTAIRGNVIFQQGMIICERRESQAAALALQYSAGDCGTLVVQTCRLPAREEPYILSLELARHRLMTLYTKLEEWGMFDLGPDHPVIKRADLARKLFIEALCLQNDNPIKADKYARDCLIASLDGSEELALAHAELFLSRRKTTGAIPRHPIGCSVNLEQANERLRAGLHANFDFINLPTPWKGLAPEEGDYRFAQMDNWIEWAYRNKVPIVAGPIVCFDPSLLPDWLFIWEHDYETVRDVIYEHVETIVTRYRGYVGVWNVVSGLHVNSHFTFSFEQLIDLTRMTTMLVRKLQPAAKIQLEIRQPFGEYTATHTKSIPPVMYTEAMIQRLINFDAISIRLLMGQVTNGQYVRDLMQLSNVIDDFSGFQKSINITFGVPSEASAIDASGKPIEPPAGTWRRPWSPVVQSRWVEAVAKIALSKPSVETITWNAIIDHKGMDLPLSGLTTAEMQPKPAFRRLVELRKSLIT